MIAFVNRLLHILIFLAVAGLAASVITCTCGDDDDDAGDGFDDDTGFR
ncbi:MAG: hypothetical protein M5R36_14510 [Deltaproteobacteria bacterium]|nr:hypothetical protein [Deltaproteobacteria bacterium]